MLDYSFLDSILDCVFVIDRDCKVTYCNDAAATLCQSSVRRLIGKAILTDVIKFGNPGLLPLSEGAPGWSTPSPLVEVEFQLVKTNGTGKVQAAIRPVTDGEWFIYVRDVSLEEVLHSKYRNELVQKEGYIKDLEDARAQLQDYSKNLEKVVEERTSQLRSVNMSLSAILNSLGQGFFIFDKTGVCGSVYTRSCETLLGVKPEGLNAWDVLGIPPHGFPQFQKWMESCFAEYLPFDDMKALGPDLFPAKEGRRVSLEYYPIRNEQEKVQSIVVVATDRTAEHMAQMALENEKQYASMILKFVRNKDQFLQFIKSVKSSFVRLHEIAQKEVDSNLVFETFRILHTIEGEAGTFSMNELRTTSRKVQQWLEPFKLLKTTLQGDERAHLAKLLVEMDAEFSQFLEENKELIKIPKSNDSKSLEIDSQKLKELFKGLQKQAVSAKFLEPYEDVFFKETFESRIGYYDGLIQSIAARLDKKMTKLEIVNGEARILAEPFQKLFSAFVHAIRNAVDHGIEMPEEREWAGKPPEGKISIEMCESAADFKFYIRDDGKGISPEIIRQKLLEKMPDKDFSAQTDEQVIQAIFLPNFSSREEIGEFSGRGVGLDALQDEVKRMGGQVIVKSEVGKGTVFEIIVPKPNQSYDFARSA